MGAERGRKAGSGNATAVRVFDVLATFVLLVLIAPLLALIALTIKLDSRGPVFYRCLRVGQGGRVFSMIKFRKMGADAAGPPLTIAGDARFTRLGRLLAASKLDELPQLWNVLKGDMSLVGPRPEDPSFVALREDDYAEVLRVRPGITGLSQLAFVQEGRILDPSAMHDYYIERLQPQKIQIDKLYARTCSLGLNVSILLWTIAAVAFKTDVAVNRTTGKLGVRRRPSRVQEAPELSTDAVMLAQER
jgi:lipopolysaccharide/colanic/teichoic acid biosynthesis glycosyltransferase